MSGMVLVVDDDEGVRAVMATALEDDGWTVETAENGRTALETLNWARPEAIILDLQNAGHGRADLCRAVSRVP